MTEFSEARAKRILLISLVVVGMGFTVLFPILAPVGREMGLTEFQITAIIGASSITVFLASPRWGRLSDRLGRKAVILIGLFGFAFGTFLFNGVIYLGLSAAITGTTLFAALVASRMVHAAVMSATMPAANAFMADITSPENRTKGMGAAGAANNLGSMLGPAVAALAVFSLLMPLWVMAALAFLNGLFLWRFLPEPPRHNAPRLGAKMRYRDPRIFPFIIVGVTMFSGMALVQQTMGFRFQDALSLSATETAQAVGLGMMLSAAASLLAQGVVVQRLSLAPFTLLRVAMPLMFLAFRHHGSHGVAMGADRRHDGAGLWDGACGAWLYGGGVLGRFRRGAGRGSGGGGLLRPPGLRHWSHARGGAIPASADPALRRGGGGLRGAVSVHGLAGAPPREGRSGPGAPSVSAR